jgi:hypothetical protein
VNEHSPDTSLPKSARRRLLRGAFAAPTVLTLYSGGAMAAKSQALRCVVNQNKNPINGASTPAVAASNLTYVRVQLYAVGGVNYVRGQDLPPARSASLPTNSQAQIFNTGTNLLTGSPVGTPGSLVAQPLWAVLRVDSLGNVVNVGATGTGGSAIFRSCWTSFITP